MKRHAQRVSTILICAVFFNFKFAVTFTTVSTRGNHTKNTYLKYKMSQNDVNKLSNAKERLRVVVGTDLTPEDKTKVYDYNADVYDKEKCCDVICKYIPNGKREKIEVLDVGAGTGKLGKLLFDKGFMTIDAVDPSSGMLSQAKEKNVYRNLYCDYMTASSKDIFASDFYDVIVSCGCFCPGHLPFDAVIEMIRITKPGGLIILSARSNQFEGDSEYKEFFPLCNRLEKEGKWTNEETTKYIGYAKKLNADGFHIVFRVI